MTPRSKGERITETAIATVSACTFSSPGAGPDAQLAAVSFLHRFGSALKPLFHFHLVVLDGPPQPDLGLDLEQPLDLDHTPRQGPAEPELIPDLDFDQSRGV